MFVLSLILIIVSFLILGFSIYKIHNIHQADLETDRINQQIQIKNKQLDEETKKKLNEYNIATCKVKEVNKTLNTQQELLSKQEKILNNQEELSRKAFENYCDVLDKDYEEKNKEYKIYTETLKSSYSDLQSKLMQEIDKVKSDLNKIQETRTAATEAIRREKEIEKKLSFYCLQVNQVDLKDIGILDSIKPKLTNPRILSMLIWQTYFRKPMTDLCNNVIGPATKCGVYKITNIKTKECYIGQAADLASRWKDHAKCGLGIDTPAANKLYKAMQEYGIWNFSWEIIEICKREELNEKEKYYIELYDSKNFGYNGNKGVSK